MRDIEELEENLNRLTSNVYKNLLKSDYRVVSSTKDVMECIRYNKRGKVKYTDHYEYLRDNYNLNYNEDYLSFISNDNVTYYVYENYVRKNRRLFDMFLNELGATKGDIVQVTSIDDKEELEVEDTTDGLKKDRKDTNECEKTKKDEATNTSSISNKVAGSKLVKRRSLPRE